MEVKPSRQLAATARHVGTSVNQSGHAPHFNVQMDELELLLREKLCTKPQIDFFSLWPDINMFISGRILGIFKMGVYRSCLLVVFLVFKYAS